MRVLITLIIVLALLATSAFGVGYYSPVAWQGSQARSIHEPEEKLWRILSDIPALHDRKPEITRIETLPDVKPGYKRWREHTDMGGTIDFEVTDIVPNDKISIRMTDSTFGMRGTWTYMIEGDDVTTRVTITEASEVTNMWLRALLTVMGRNVNIRQEFRHIMEAADRP